MDSALYHRVRGEPSTAQGDLTVFDLGLGVELGHDPFSGHGAEIKLPCVAANQFVLGGTHAGAQFRAGRLNDARGADG